jgi:cytochrome c biogenesis protein CcdA
MLPLKTLVFCFALACGLSAIGYWFLAGVGTFYDPTDSQRAVTASLFGLMGLLALYTIWHLRRLERRQRAQAEDANKSIKIHGLLHPK